jgi:hypothetical protein
MKKKVCLLLSDDAVDVLEYYAYFHNTTMDDVADASIMMMPFYEKRTEQIREMREQF